MTFPILLQARAHLRANGQLWSSGQVRGGCENPLHPENQLRTTVCWTHSSWLFGLYGFLDIYSTKTRSQPECGWGDRCEHYRWSHEMVTGRVLPAEPKYLVGETVLPNSHRQPGHPVPSRDWYPQHLESFPCPLSLWSKLILTLFPGFSAPGSSYMCCCLRCRLFGSSIIMCLIY